MPVWAVAMAPSPTVQWPATPTWPAKMTFLPTWVEPARPTWAQSRVSGADRGAVADLDEVVDLGAGVDAGFADGGAVDAGVGLDLDVVFKDGAARLQDFVPGAPSDWRAKPKPSAPMMAPFCRMTWLPRRQCSRTTAWAWAKKLLPMRAWG